MVIGSSLPVTSFVYRKVSFAVSVTSLATLLPRTTTSQGPKGSVAAGFLKVIALSLLLHSMPVQVLLFTVEGSGEISVTSPEILGRPGTIWSSIAFVTLPRSQ